jgi:hypothetical protein
MSDAFVVDGCPIVLPSRESDGQSDSHIRLLFVQIKRLVRDVVAVRGFQPLGMLPDKRRY